MSVPIDNQASDPLTGLQSTNLRKRRIACDNCHFSKVRCTGEISGCQRCKRGHKTCIYGESNMGRIPPGAKRRKASSVDTRPSREASTSKDSDAFMTQGHNWGSTSPFDSVGEHQEHGHHRQPFDALSLDPLDGELPSPGFDPLIPSFDDLDFSDVDDTHFASDYPIGLSFSHCSPIRTAKPHNQQQQQGEQDQQQQQQQLDASQLIHTPPVSTAQSYNESVDFPSSEATSPPSTDDGVRYWAAQLEALSRTPRRIPIPLDDMLQHSSQLLPRVTEALRPMSSQADELPSSTTSLILILLCLTQAVELFEQCVPVTLGLGAGESGQSGTGTGSRSGSDDLSLRLGGFRIDAEAQQALQMHIIGRELSTILQACKMARQMLLRPAWRGVSKRTHGLLLDDVRTRTLALVYQMKQKAGTSRIISL